MSSVIGAVVALLFGGVFGFIFISPIFLIKWYKEKKEKKKRQFVESQLQQKYSDKEIVFVRYSVDSKLKNQFKMSNFNGTGFLVLGENSIVYHDLDEKKPTLTFPIQNLSVEWIGYYLGSGWVPWFRLTIKDSEAVYFTGDSVNWAKNMDLFRTVAKAVGDEVEIKAAEKLNVITNNRDASWFTMIACLTLANTVLVLCKTHISFILGLAVVQLFDGMLISTGENPMVGLSISVFVSLILMKLGIMAKQGKINVYRIGLIILSLDSLLLLGLIIANNMSVVYLLINVIFRTGAISAMVRGAFVQQAPSKK